MLINNIPIEEFGASVSSKKIHFTELFNTSEIIKDRIVSINNKKGFKQIEFRILFQAENTDVIYKNMSNFTKHLSKEFTLKFKNLSNYFYCYPATTSVEDTPINEMMYLTGTFNCYEYSIEEEKIIDRINSKEIDVKGNLNTPCILEIIPYSDMIDITIGGLSEGNIRIENLKENTPIIIDGEKGEVIQNGVNKFADIDLWEFPYLKNGTNTVTVDKRNCKIKIKYKPRWI